MGNIRVLEEGLELNNVEKSKRDKAVVDYFEMKGKAEADGDRFWALESLFSKKYSYGLLYPDFFYAEWNNLQKASPLNGLSQRAIQLIQGACGQYRTGMLSGLEEFNSKSEPKTRAGFGMVNLDDYIFDTSSWLKWHDDWQRAHLDTLNWEMGNLLFHDYRKSIQILSSVLKSRQEEGLCDLAKIKISDLPDREVVNIFHDVVMKRTSGEERIALTKEIGKRICEFNYYQYEGLLSRLEEARQRESHHESVVIREIYSIVREGNRQFISLDTRHGMFEFHNAKGEHLGEYRFDGTQNSPNETSHNLLAIGEWEKQK